MTLRRSSSKYWSQIAKRYYRARRDSLDTNILLNLLNENIGAYNPHSVLEIGSGPGIFTENLYRKAWTVSTDISRRMLKFTKRRGIKAEFIQADMEHLPFKHDSFDMIVAYRVLEYSGNGTQTLRQFSKIAPIMLVQIPRHDSFRGFMLLLYRWARFPVLLLFKKNVRFKSYSFKSVAKLLKRSRLSQVRLITYNNGLDIHVVLRRNQH